MAERAPRWSTRCCRGCRWLASPQRCCP